MTAATKDQMISTNEDAEYGYEYGMFQIKPEITRIIGSTEYLKVGNRDIGPGMKDRNGVIFSVEKSNDLLTFAWCIGYPMTDLARMEVQL